MKSIGEWQDEYTGCRVREPHTSLYSLNTTRSDDAGSKIDAAKAKGVEVWTEAEFQAVIGGAADAPAEKATGKRKTASKKSKKEQEEEEEEEVRLCAVAFFPLPICCA